MGFDRWGGSHLYHAATHLDIFEIRPVFEVVRWKAEHGRYQHSKVGSLGRRALVAKDGLRGDSIQNDITSNLPRSRFAWKISHSANGVTSKPPPRVLGIPIQHQQPFPSPQWLCGKSWWGGATAPCKGKFLRCKRKISAPIFRMEFQKYGEVVVEPSHSPGWGRVDPNPQGFRDSQRAVPSPDPDYSLHSSRSGMEEGPQ